MTIRTKQYGAVSERRAKEYLEARGFQFVGANIRNRYGEIDVLMRDGLTLVAVEVKARHTKQQGSPAEAITAAKLKHLSQTMAALVSRTGLRGPWRIDVVAISGGLIRHLRNVTS